MAVRTRNQVIAFRVTPAEARKIREKVRRSGLSQQELEQIVADNTQGKLLGIFGEETVNVLGVNLDIAESMGLIREAGKQ